ncbi:MAG: transposase [Actinobacteria bacterium]|nr:transposase [Actinomycetota bacterium]
MIGTASATDAFGSTSTFSRQSAWCWDTVPRPLITGEIYDYLIIDAKPLKGSVCAIVRCQKYVRNWRHGASENAWLWLDTLSDLPRPSAIVCDGQRGIFKALDTLWPAIVIQRCHIHVRRNIRVKLTRNPQTEAGADLKWLMSRLGSVSDEFSMAIFVALFDMLYDQHRGFLNERTHNTNLQGNRRWWYTHSRVRSAYRQIDKLINDNQLFAFILYPELKLPNNTNGLEGGINSRLDELISRHRGLSIKRQQRLVDWYLDSRTEQLYLEQKSTQIEH